MESMKKETASLQKIRDNPQIFGKMFDKDKKKLKTITQTPLNGPANSHSEESLLDSAGVNHYERAFVYMLFANFRQSHNEKSEMLRRSIECIKLAQQQEIQMHKERNERSKDNGLLITRKTSEAIWLTVSQVSEEDNKYVKNI